MTTPPHDEWDAAFHADPDESEPSGGDEGASGTDEKPPAPKYPTVEAWVTHYLAPLIRWPSSNRVCWCPEWWRHPEAVARLEALWRAWEALRRDGTTGMSVWFRDHLDIHLGFLTDADRSPLSRCTVEGHRGEHRELRVTPAPADWWGNQEPHDGGRSDDKGQGEPAA
ncbi:hypothetical protein GCM10012275_60690 [Longimycelium tulufanense]|uniref:DUF4913 domain-containing protein n=1 Tax=Longimycelium tulufanense TaxID=907463 RepID=A0A8J3CL99_9PSEU|nr:DUF4913 domain-containing protein [Longimycelium tulufanense]GGM81957.1 hypothetical protein GCM10012275_60690 [Longimycelium tulufanense]